MLDKVWIKNFRNLREVVLPIKRGQTICIWGKNNQGKTNLLEALYVLCNGASPSEKLIEHTVCFDQNEAFLGADINNDEDFYRVYLKISDSGHRSIIINNTEVNSLKTLTNLISAEYMSADVIRIFQESPDFRRKEIDRFISLLDPLYKKTLRDYFRVMKQKNKYLKQSEMIKRDVVAIFNSQLVSLGDYIVKMRLIYLKELEQQLISILKDVIPQFGIETSMHYVKSRLNDEIEPYHDVYLAQLTKDFEKECFNGVTLSGPHRDDFLITINKKSLFSFYSRGINRSYAICFKLAQLALLEKKYGKFPILLLDDTFAELDDTIKGELSKAIEDRAQLVYTSVLPEDHHLFRTVASFQMKNGELIEA